MLNSCENFLNENLIVCLLLESAKTKHRELKNGETKSNRLGWQQLQTVRRQKIKHHCEAE